MANLQIELEWYRCSKGYRLVEHGSGDMIVPDGRDVVPSPPFEKLDRLYTVFANVKTQADLLRFIEEHGLLGMPPMEISSRVHGAGDSVPRCLKSAEEFRELLSHNELLSHKQKSARQFASFFDALLEARRKELKRQVASVLDALVRAGNVSLSEEFQKATGRPSSFQIVQKGTGLPLRHSSSFQFVGLIELVSDPSRGVRLRIRAENLIGALWWQLAQKLSGSAIIRECPHCGAWFEAGPGKSRQRADSKFCSEEHKKRYWSLQRSRGK
jgi:hypothetical protein